MAKIDDAGQIQEIREELRDRFGPLPAATSRMLELAELRLDAAAWQISAITSDARFIILHYSNRRQMERLVQTSSIAIRIVDRTRAYIPTKGYDMQVDAVGTSWLQLARATLHIG